MTTNNNSNVQTANVADDNKDDDILMFDPADFEAMKQKQIVKLQTEIDNLSASLNSIEYSMKHLLLQQTEKNNAKNARVAELERMKNMTLDSLLAGVPDAKSNENQ